MPIAIAIIAADALTLAVINSGIRSASTVKAVRTRTTMDTPNSDMFGEADVVLLCKSEVTPPDQELMEAAAQSESLILLAADEISGIGVTKCLSAGIPGIMRRPDDPELMADAVIQLHESGTYFDPAVRQAILDHHVTPEIPAASTFTPTETRIAPMLAEGWTNMRIAHRLGVTERTIKGHVSRMYVKLAVRSRAEAVSVLHGHAVPSSN